MGRLVRPDTGAVTFSEATVDLGTGTSRLTEASLLARDERLRISGEELIVAADGAIRGTRVTVACACDGRSPWSIRAGDVTVKLDEEVVLRRGWIRIFDIPVVPVPAWSLPLERRSGFLPPAIGYGQDGLRAQTPVYLTLGPSADLTLTPALRTDRSLRLLAETRFATRQGTGEIRGSGGQDWLLGEPRGAASWSVLQAGRLRLGTAGQILSDKEQLRDYGDAFLARATPWTEARLLLGYGPLEVDHDSFQFAGPIPQQVARVALRQPQTPLPFGMLGTVHAEASWLREGEAFWQTGTDQLVGGAQAGLSRPTVVGPVLIEPSVDAGVTRTPETDAWTRGTVHSRLLLWKPTAGGVARIEPGVVAALSAGEGPAPWEVAPSLIARASGAGLAEIRVDAPYRTEGLSLQSAARVQVGPVTARGQITTHALSQPDPLSLAVAEIRLAPRPLSVWGRWVLGDAPDDTVMHQAASGVELRAIPSLTLGYATAIDIAESQVNSHAALVGWRHPTGCVALGATARFDRDRDLPDVRVQATILPR